MLYVDQHYRTWLWTVREPANAARLTRLGAPCDTWALSPDQARRVGRALIDLAAEADEAARTTGKHNGDVT